MNSSQRHSHDLLYTPGHSVTLIDCQCDTEGTLSVGIAYFDKRQPANVKLETPAGELIISIPQELQNRPTYACALNIRLEYQYA